MTGARTALVLLVALAALVALQEVDDRRPRTHGEAGPAPATGELSAGAAAAALGGFRLPALAALWLDCDRLWREQRWWALRSRYELIVRLEPRIPTVWGYLADLMMLNLADRAPDPETRWAWTREGLDLLDRGIEANPESELLLLQRIVRLSMNVAQDARLAARYEAWRGRPLLDDALDAARDLADRHPGDPEEAARIPHVRKAFAWAAFRRAWAAPDRDTWARAAALWREAAAGYRALGEPVRDLAEYATVFAGLCDEMPRLDDPEARNRLVRERLSRFKDYVEAHELLEAP